MSFVSSWFSSCWLGVRCRVFRGLCAHCVDRRKEAGDPSRPPRLCDIRGDRDELAWALLAVRVMSRARQTLGKIGEDLACRELERRGYAIIARRYRLRGGELDIIARDGPTIVFVEVKARAGQMRY